MSIDVLPMPLNAEPPRPDRRIVAMAVLSVVAHLLLLGLVLIPRQPLPLPGLTTIDVELVPPEAVSSEEPSTPPAETEPSQEGASAEPPGGGLSSEQQMPSEQPASAEASASEAPPSTEPSAAEPSAADASSAPAEEQPSAEPATQPSAEPIQETTAPSPPPPAMPHPRPLIIPVGPSADLSEPATPADEAAAPSPESADGAPPPIEKGLLRASKRFYLDAMLDAEGMAQTREALAKLPPERRLARSCNIEAIGQIGAERRDLSPDALVANAFAEPVTAAETFSVSNGAFRSAGKWYALAYECSLSADLSEVKVFAFHIGGDVTAVMEARLAAKP